MSKPRSDSASESPERPAASENASNASVTEPLVVLLLTSHAHSPPLRPPAQLKYDLRSIQNPPKALRDSHTGVSKRLREHLRSHPDFVALLDQAETDIQTAVAGLEAATSGEGGVTLSVAGFCARGHHRSVAFVEELATRAWPSGWEVEVVHRDLHVGRSRQGKQRKGGRGCDGSDAGGFHLVLGNE